MKFDDLKVGMMISDGLITRLHKSGTDSQLDLFWSGRNAVTCIMVQGAYHGQSSFACDNDQEFEEIAERGSYEYVKNIGEMAGERLSAVDHALEDVELIYSFLLSEGESDET